MIGRLRFPYRQSTAEAVLQEDGRWQCHDVPSLVRVLDALYSPRRDGPSIGDQRARRHHLHAAAQWLKGTVEADAEASERN